MLTQPACQPAGGALSTSTNIKQIPLALDLITLLPKSH